jgi:predicted nucleotidyltransferase
MNRDTSQTGLSEAVLTRLRDVFAACPGVEQVILYGSRAKGIAQRGSDIDLVLKGRTLTGRDLSAMANSLDDLLLPYKIDLALDSQIDNPALREHLDRVGIVLYAREVGKNDLEHGIER